jgi:type II secretory pathway pseudopilin PulG
MSLRSKEGISLLEGILMLSIAVLMMSAVLGVYKQRVQRGRMDQTVNDMVAIADAALNYNNSTGNWPASLADLEPAYLPAAVSINAFGSPYVLVCATGQVSVSSKTPAGLAQNTSLGSLFEVSSAGGGYDLVTITKREQIGSVGRLRYDKKYFYHE